MTQYPVVKVSASERDVIWREADWEAMRLLDTVGTGSPNIAHLRGIRERLDGLCELLDWIGWDEGEGEKHPQATFDIELTPGVQATLAAIRERAAEEFADNAEAHQFAEQARTAQHTADRVLAGVL